MQKAYKTSTFHLPFFVVVFTRLSASFVAAHASTTPQLPQATVAVFVSAAACQFGGCRLARAIRVAPLRFALNQGEATAWPGLNFFPAVSRSQYCSPLRRLRCVPVLRWRVNCRNTATSLLKK